MSRLILGAFFVAFLARLAVACYRGDPGYGGVDYPPEPPIVDRAADAGRG